VLTGTVVNPHEFEGRVMAAQLFQFAEDPRLTENERDYRGNAGLEEYRRLRMEVQRQFTGAKAKNVEPYSDYIIAVHEGADGITPTIVLWTEETLPVDEGPDGAARMMIPFVARLVAIDGETQLAGRYIARDKNKETAKEWVAGKICHGRSIPWARQAFHDLNNLAVPSNKALAIAMDSRDPLTTVARRVEESVPFFRNRINKVSRQLKKRDKANVMTITSLRGACVTLAKGINGVQYGAGAVSDVPPAQVPVIEEVAIAWFRAVTDKIGSAIEDRERTVASSPAVMAALGAMGHVLVETDDPQERKQKMTELLVQLSNVSWERSQNWEGIAGKFTPKGQFSLGGAKENGYAVYAALTDSGTQGYHRIRAAAPAPTLTSAA
jgi:DNA sulfur modification protein DndB